MTKISLWCVYIVSCYTYVYVILESYALILESYALIRDNFTFIRESFAKKYFFSY